MDNREEGVPVSLPKVVILPREQVAQLQEVVEAARALLSGPNGEEGSWVQNDDWRALEAALRALEENPEGGER